MIENRASDFLPKELQNAINTFIEQFNIMEEYDLDYIPTQYTVNLFKTEYSNVLLDLMDIIENKELEK